MSGSPKRFRIAFSFAGEKRDFVAQVAAILAEQFGEPAILYDKFHEAEFARNDLSIYLPNLYNRDADLVVVIVCPDYDAKDWTGLEWLGIHDLLKQRRREEVMLCRFARAQVDGLFGGAGFIELDDKTPEQAATLILERLALNEGKDKDHYTRTSAPGSDARDSSFEIRHSKIPNNLPRLQPFFGRAAELATLREALDPDSRTWGALIDGPGGMGKTSLAVRAAYDCPPGLFHCIVFVSVKDREMDDDGERPLGNLLVPGFLEMLNELARELGQPDIAKSPEDQRIRLLLDALRPAQALLILDNLESLPKTDRDQLFTFVKRLPPGCKAILTSRRRIGSGSEELILEKLEQDATLATLADLVQRNPLLARTSEAERIALYTQTAGKPLLLRWVAGQLGRGSCRTVTDALAFLRSCPPNNDPLEFIFGDLAKEFTPEEEKVLCALTYFSLPAKVEHLAEITGLEEAAAETALRTLANRSLVVPDQEEQAHSLVPMVAEFLHKHRPEMVADIGNQIGNCAYGIVVDNGYRNRERFSDLDSAWPLVAPALPIFAAGPNRHLQTVCEALQFFLEFTGRWDEWRSLEQHAEKKATAEADELNDELNAGWRAKNLAYLSSLLSDADAVIEHADRAAEHWHNANAGPLQRANAIRLRGLGLRLSKNYPAAIAACKEALTLWRSVAAESINVAVGLTSLAATERDSGDLGAAEESFHEALRVACSINYEEGMAFAMYNLAVLATDHEDWKQMEHWSRQALPLADIVGRSKLTASICRLLAIALLRQGKGGAALEYARRAVGILTPISSPELEAARATLRECETALGEGEK